MIPEREGTFVVLKPAVDGLEEGQIICVDSNGKAVGVGDSAVRVIGVAYDVSDVVTVKRGVFKLQNSSDSALGAADIGANCYAKDSNTVQKAQPTSGFQGVVGKVLGVDEDGVWVEIR